MGGGEEPKGGLKFVLPQCVGFGREWVYVEGLFGEYVNLSVLFLVKGFCTLRL